MPQPSGERRGGFVGNGAGVQMAVHPHAGHEIADVTERLFAAGVEREAEHQCAHFASAARLQDGGAHQLDEAAFAVFLQREIANALFIKRDQIGHKLL